MLGNARLRLFLRAVIGVALLGWLVHRTGFGPQVLQAPQRTLAAGGVTSLVLAVGQALSAWRWKLLLGSDAPRWLDLFRIYLIGQFAGLFLPTSVGGDVVRIAAVSRVKPAALTVSSVFLDRALGFVALLVYLLIGVFLAPAHAADWGDRLRWGVPSPWLLGVAVLGLVLLLAVALSRALRRVREFARDTLRAMTGTFRREPGRFAGALLLSFLVQGLYIGAWGAAAAGLGLTLPLEFLLFAVPFVSLAMMLPVTISGMGVREGVWALLLVPLGIPGASGVALGLLFFAAFSLVGAAGGVWLAVRGTALAPDGPSRGSRGASTPPAPNSSQNPTTRRARAGQ